MKLNVNNRVPKLSWSISLISGTAVVFLGPVEMEIVRATSGMSGLLSLFLLPGSSGTGETIWQIGDFNALVGE